ncbi:MAG TPA: EAL domain-containing protein [Candidatus Limnocylindrales bacterium]|nr:EAL domain-containing protein [Candidatus Limnocylindrales bacterium]
MATPLDPGGGIRPGSGILRWPVGRLVAGALALTLVGLSAFAIVATTTSQQAIADASRAGALSAAFQEARFQIATEEALEQEYRLSPGPQIRSAFAAAGESFVQALQPVFALGNATDATEARTLINLHEQYVAGSGQLFDAIDYGNAAQVAKLAQQVEPTFTRLESEIGQHATLENTEATQSLLNANRTGTWLQETTPITFGLGLLLLAVFSLISRTYRRRMDIARRHEAQAEIERTRATAAAEQRALQRSEERFRALLQYAADLVTVVSPEGVILYQSDSSMRVLGYDPTESVGKSLFDFILPEDVPAVKRFLAATLRKAGQTVTGEVHALRRDRTALALETIGLSLIDKPAVGGILLTSRDLTERKALEERLQHQALHDPLTGLPNRTLFLDRLSHGLARSRRSRDLLAVLFLDLDDFKVVNDSMGHKAGDTLLQSVALQVQSALRPGDSVARLGGDEFTVLLEGLRQPEDAIQVAERIARQLATPVPLEGRSVIPTASIGIALSTTGADAADDLLRNADVAMYAAKSEGKARYAVFSASMQSLAWERMAMELDLRRAVAQNEFRAFYQPIVDLASRKVDEVEVLVRWQHPERGLLPPAAFIPLAETTGIIVPIGRWVLKEACRQLRAWQLEYGARAPARVSVNLSARQFQQPHLVDDVEGILAETGLDAKSLTLEITETVMVQDAEGARKTLDRLRAIGIQIAVDDFGTGYSSLTYLQQFPIDVLKIDRSFVSRMGGDPENEAIVRAVVTLARTLNLDVVGEGIEEAGQAAALEALGCRRGQGYYFARPLSQDEVVDLFPPDASTPAAA